MSDEVLPKGPSEVAVPATSKEAIASYEHVVDAAELIAVRLQNVKFDVDHAFFGGADIELGYGVKNGEISVFSEEGFAGIQVHMDVTARAGRKKLVACVATYEVLYRGIERCDDAAVRSFLSRVGRFTAYPYFRGLVGHLGDSSGTHLPPLPVLKEKVLPAKRRKKTVSASKTSD